MKNSRPKPSTQIKSYSQILMKFIEQCVSSHTANADLITSTDNADADAEQENIRAASTGA